MDIVQISQAGSCAIDTFQVSINDTVMVSMDTRLILQPEILLHTKKSPNYKKMVEAQLLHRPQFVPPCMSP
jgi:hypothetical protein